MSLCPVHSSISGLYPLDASSFSLVVTVKNVSALPQVPWKTKSLWLGTTDKVPFLYVVFPFPRNLKLRELATFSSSPSHLQVALLG